MWSSSLLYYCVLIFNSTASTLLHDHRWRANGVTRNLSNSITSKPHILFVVMDDLGSSDLGSGTYTPTFDQLAKEGMTLEKYYVYPSCSPTRAAIFTGRHATSTGIFTAFAPDEPMSVPSTFKMLSEAMRENGYATHLVGKWHLGGHTWESTPTFRGFDSFYGFLGWQEGYFDHEEADGNFQGNNIFDFHHQAKPYCGNGCHSVQWSAKGTYSTKLFANRTLEIINNHNVDIPLFLFLAEQAPHGPVDAPSKYKEYPYLPRGSKRDKQFAGTLAAADVSLNAIKEALESKGMLNNTIIIVTSDNGGPTRTGSSNFPLRGGKHTLFEGGIRVTGFIWCGSSAPQVKKGSFKGLMHAVDWFPTLMHVTGGSAQLEGHGLNQWTAFATGTYVRDGLFLGGMYDPEGGSAFAYAVRYKNWKLIVGAPGRQSFSGWSHSDGQGMEESRVAYDDNSILLFNLDEDEREVIDVASSQSGIVSTMMAVARLHTSTLVGRNHAKDLSCGSMPITKGAALLPWCQQQLNHDYHEFATSTGWCGHGIKYDDICCDAACGTCGGDACGLRPGGATKCCAQAIANISNPCKSFEDVACVIPAPTLPIPAFETSTGWCGHGIKYDDTCCDAECGTCGGDTCDLRPGGATKCCAQAIANIANPCKSFEDVACVIPASTLPISAP